MEVIKNNKELTRLPHLLELPELRHRSPSALSDTSDFFQLHLTFPFQEISYCQRRCYGGQTLRGVTVGLVPPQILSADDHNSSYLPQLDHHSCIVNPVLSEINKYIEETLASPEHSVLSSETALPPTLHFSARESIS